MTPTVESIWENLASQLRNFIRARVRDHSAAEDILQEVFVKIHRKLPTLRAGGRDEAWVWRVTRNAITDHFRRTRPSKPLPAELTSDSERELELPDLTPCIRRFVGELPPTYRDALVLTEWQRADTGPDGQATRTFDLRREIRRATRAHPVEGTVARLLSVRIGPTRQR